MTLRQYLVWMLLSTLLCWGGWFAVIATVDPTQSGWVGYALFYAALCLSLVGTFSLLGLSVRSLARKHEPVTRHAATSFRQSLLLTVLVAVALMLQSRSLLTWWNLAAFIATLTILEFFMISFRSGR